MKGQRLRDYWYNIYRQGLKQFGIILKELKKPTKRSLEKARKLSKQARKEYEKEYKEKAPSIREAYKREIIQEQERADYRDTERDTETNRTRTPSTEEMYDYSVGVIEDFIKMIDDIYRDTQAYIEDHLEEGQTHITGKLAALANQPENRIDFYNSYTRLKEKVYSMQAIYGSEVLADAIVQSPHLDYAIGIYLTPPSTVESNFEITLGWLEGLTLTLDAKAQKLAQEAEEKYYKG